LRILITGANGFLGSSLARCLLDAGHKVSGSVRAGSRQPAGRIGIDEIGVLELGRPFDKDLFRQRDVVIHCAHDFSPGSVARNVDGTRAIYEAARDAGVVQQAFLGSYSARRDSPVDYGRIKYELETFFLAAGQVVIRPGLVIGNGGLFGRNMRKILASPVIPLPDGGRDRVPIIGIVDFLVATRLIIESGKPGAYNLFCDELVTLRELTEAVNRHAGHRAMCIGIPCSWVVFFLTAMQKLGLRFPVDVNNLKALKNTQPRIYASDLKALLGGETSMDAALSLAVSSFRTAAA